MFQIIKICVKGVAKYALMVATNSLALQRVALLPKFCYRKSTLVIVGSVIVTGLVFHSETFPGIQYLKSRILQKLRNNPRQDSQVIRNTFNDIALTEFQPLRSGHTHPIAAADRSGASSFIDRLGALLGRDTFFVQMSRADQKSGRLGSRDYYWAKDFSALPSRLTIPANPLLAMVDVDQYVDMPCFLTKHVHPMVLYTFQPDAVSKVTQNYSYTFDGTNTVQYYVTGAGIFTHMVWNYSSDHLVTSHTIFGIPYRTATYLVDRRTTSPDHELVMLTPTGHWRGLGSILYKWWIFGRSLARLKVVDDMGFARLQTHSVDGVQISTGRALSFVSAKVPVTVDDTLAVISRTSKYPLTNPQVLSFVDGKREVAAPLLDYHLSKQIAKPDVVCPLPLAVRRYQYQPGNFDSDAKPSMVAFMHPLINDAFAPDRSVGNEEECIKQRVVDVAPVQIKLTNFLATAMKEFSELLIPDPHLLDPVDHETVRDRQARPPQVRTLATAEWMLPKPLIESFSKSEAYSNIKPPRLISTVNGVDKREYSRFMYAFEVILKRQPWYAFSKTPKDIAQRVADILRQAACATNTDFSKFDGHGSNIMRELERIILLRAFRHVHHETVIALHLSQHCQRAVASFGTWYETKYSRASGSPETGLFNSLVNAFVAFLALRMTRLNGSFMQAEAAWKALGIYGGDDGLTADIKARVYRRAAFSIGQELTVEEVPRGQIGIKFLARIYSPNVWFGDMNTCCDLKRQLSKLHTTVSLPPNVTPVMKLLEKARSLILSDENTPIIGEYVRAVAHLHGEPILADDRTASMRSWLSHFDKEAQYENEACDWMMGYAASALPSFDHVRFLSWRSGCFTLMDLLSAPTFQEQTDAKSSVPVVVDGQVIPVGPTPPSLPLGRKNRVDDKKNVKPLRGEQKPFNPPVLSDGKSFNPLESEADLSALVPVSYGERAKIAKERYDRLKAHKINLGTWIERKPQTFEERKAAKIANGTWNETKHVPNSRPKLNPLTAAISPESGPPKIPRVRSRADIPKIIAAVPRVALAVNKQKQFESWKKVPLRRKVAPNKRR
jgi:hypothetical protein